MNANAINFYNEGDTNHKITHSFGPGGTYSNPEMNGLLFTGWGGGKAFCRFQAISPQTNVMELFSDKVKIPKYCLIGQQAAESGSYPDSALHVCNSSNSSSYQDSKITIESRKSTMDPILEFVSNTGTNSSTKKGLMFMEIVQVICS